MKSKFLFFKIWLCHIFIYYPVTFMIGYGSGVIYNKDTSFLSILVFSPIFGQIGFFDGLPFFAFVSMLIMAILIKTYYKRNLFIAYLLSLFPLYPVGYFIIAYINNKNFIKSLFDSYNDIQFYIIILGGIVAIAANWLIFRKAYLRIKEDVN